MSIAASSLGNVLSANTTAIVLVSVVVLLILFLVLAARRKAAPKGEAEPQAKELGVPARPKQLPASKEVFADAPAPMKKPCLLYTSPSPRD